MFTGIIQAVGKIAAIEQKGGDARMRVDTGRLDMSNVNTGDSIAVSGVCLTAVEHSASGFAADVSGETLSRTTLGRLRPGDAVNLEKALTLGTPLDGHLVSGHVDGVGTVVSREGEGRSVRFRFQVPDTLAQTTLDSFQPGSKVNLEVDLLARYLERLVLGEGAAQSNSSITREFLAQHGFIK